MNKTEVAQLLTIISGFDRREVDTITVESWSLSQAIQDADYNDAVAAAVSHYTGKDRLRYLAIGDITDACAVSSRQTKELIAADVRSARARRLVPASWPESTP